MATIDCPKPGPDTPPGSGRAPSSRWRDWVAEGGRGLALAALTACAIAGIVDTPDGAGARNLMSVSLALPLTAVLEPFHAESDTWRVLAAVGLFGYLASVLVGKRPWVPVSVREGLAPLIRELYCWIHSVTLLPVAMVLVVSGAGRLLAPAIVVLYAHHLVESPGLSWLKRLTGWMAAAAGIGIGVALFAVLWGISPSHAVLTACVAALAAALIRQPRGGAWGLRLAWAAGAVLVASCDQWLFIGLAALDTLVAWKLGLFSTAVARTVRPVALAALIASEVLLGRGIGLLMGFRPSDRFAIERQPGVELVLAYPVRRDPTLGEHLTLTAPACEPGTALVGGLSTSRWVGGGPDALAPRLRRIGARGELLAMSTEVLEPAYSSVVDCGRGELVVGEAMGAKVSVLDARSMEVRRSVDLDCPQHVSAVTALPGHGWLAVGCGPTFLLDARDLSIVKRLDVHAFDAREIAGGLELLSPPGVTRFRVWDRRDGSRWFWPVLHRDWVALDTAGTPWGPVVSRLGSVVRFDPETYEPAVERRIGVAVRYLRAHPRLPLVAGTDYLRGRLYLMTLPDLEVVGDWFVGERPREPRFDEAARYLWVGSAAGVVRVDTGASIDSASGARGG